MAAITFAVVAMTYHAASVARWRRRNRYGAKRRLGTRSSAATVTNREATTAAETRGLTGLPTAGATTSELRSVTVVAALCHEFVSSCNHGYCCHSLRPM